MNLPEKKTFHNNKNGTSLRRHRILNVYVPHNYRNAKYMKQNVTGIKEEIDTHISVFRDFNICSQ